MSQPMRLRRRLRRAVALLCLGLATAAALPAPAVAAPAPRPLAGNGPALVRTENGWVRGRTTPEGRQFLGIPYAAPPTGERRWRAPAPAADWRGVRDATGYGNDCAQNGYWAPGHEQQRTTEDCLSVNVYVPGGSSAAPRSGARPVMVWLHGGANIGGAARDAVPDAFARRTGTVVVTVNYRVGALGYLALPGTTGNFALLDQQRALRWVRANIGRFGGDRDRVTLAGESSGGGAVCAQLASPGSRGLYRAAVIQSGSYRDCAGTPRARAQANGLKFAAGLGCTEPARAAACLRAKPAREILDAQERLGGTTQVWGHTVGGAELPVQPAEAFASGRAARVPVLNGANSKEGLVFAYDTYDRWGKPLTAEGYSGALTDAFGTRTGAAARERYRLADYERPGYAYGAAFGDQLFACPALRVNPLLAGRGRLYAYEFADRTSPLFASLPQAADFDFGATHAAELNYLFKPYGRTADFTPEQRALAGQMTAYWGSFLHGTVPRAAGQAPMPEQGERPGEVLRLRTASAGGNAPVPAERLREAHRCGLWDRAAGRSGA